jgi:hypothetical protein
MPSITRRRLLGGGAVLAAGSYGAYRLQQGAVDATFASWTPTPGTWPLRRYDPANTAHNPNASPPREPPTARQLTSAPTTDRRPSCYPLAGPEYVASYGSGLAVSPPTGGEPVLASDAATPLAGFGPDGMLHAVERRPDGVDAPSAIVGYAADDLRATSRVALDADSPKGMTVGSGELYVGTVGEGVHAVDLDTRRRWRVDGVVPALGDSRLYTAGALDGTLAYARRTGLDRRLTPGPKRVWRADDVSGFLHPPAVADGRLVVGTYAEGGGVVAGFDADTGDPLWEPRALGTDVSTPAVVGGSGYVAVGTDDRSAGVVTALDLTTGETRWRDDVEWHAFSPAVGSETLVVAGEVREGGERTAGKVRAYDTAAGDVLWTHTVETNRLGGLALVGDRVLVTAGSSLYELV